MTSDLAVRLSVPELVAVYAQAEADIRAGFALVRGGTRRLTETVALAGNAMRLRGRYGDSPDLDETDVNRVLVELRRDVWRALVERMELRRLMSVSAWEELSRKLGHEEPPDITMEIVEGMARGFAQSVPEMLEAAVKEVFEWLRPPGSKYKTNSEYEIGERVILCYVLEDHKYTTRWRVEYNHRQELIALENVMALLDGKRPGAEGQHYSELQTRIEAIPLGHPCHGGTPLFEFRGHKNRTLHLKFRRMDLVRKLNAVAGGARLRSAA